MKGIILAGGNGTRLRPLTYVANKHLLPVYNKPMVLYPLETLKHLGIRDILIVSGGEHIGWFTEFLGDGSNYGVKLTYKVQTDAGGIAQALGLAEDFANGEQIAVILGDNIYSARDMDAILGSHKEFHKDFAHVFCKQMPPEEATRFGVYFRKVLYENTPRIIEKPTREELGDQPGEVITGLYIYPAKVFDIIKTLKPSLRGELEITDVNNAFLQQSECIVHNYRGFWSDAGTFDSLLKAANWAQSEYGKRV